MAFKLVYQHDSSVSASVSVSVSVSVFVWSDCSALLCNANRMCVVIKKWICDAVIIFLLNVASCRCTSSHE
jgi:hypothetical protein